MDVSKYLIPDYKPYFDGADFPEMERPSLPEDWSQPVDGFSYVAPSNPNATDTGNTYGSRSLPRKTLPKTTPELLEHPAGFVCVVSGNIAYTGNGQVSFACQGTPENPVWLCGESAFDRFTTGQNIFITGQCVIVEHYEVTDAGSVTVRNHPTFPDQPCNRICFRDCYGKEEGNFISGANAAFSIEASELYPDIDHPYKRRDIIVCRTYLTDFGSHQWTYDNGGDAGSHDFHGFFIGRTVSRVWVIECEASRCQGDGIQIGVAQLDDLSYPDHVYVGGCTFHLNGENSVDFKKCRKVIFSSNECITIGASIVSHDYAEDIWMLNNTFKDSTRGAVLTSCIRNYLVGNRFYDIYPNDDVPDQTGLIWGQCMVIFLKGATDSYVLNNTVSGYFRCVEAHSGNVKFANNTFKGKVQRLSQVNPVGEDFVAESSFRNSSVLRNNVFQDWYGRYWSGSTYSEDVEELNVDGNSGNVMITEQGYNEEKGTGFLTLKSDSPLIDFGDQEYFNEAMVLFEDMFGIPLDRDMFGYLRVNNTIDAGCNEYGEVFAAAPPRAPIDIYIDVISRKLRWTLNSLNEEGVEVYKDDILVASLPPMTEEYFNEDLITEVNTYQVVTTNESGSGKGLTITSTIMDAVEIEGATINTDNEYLVPRGGKYNIGEGTISRPVHEEGALGISVDSFGVNVGGTLCKGYEYSRNEISGSIDCSFLNSQCVYDIGVVYSNNGEKAGNADFVIRNSVVHFDALGTVKKKVTITVDKEKIEFTLKPDNVSITEAVGVAYIEQIV